MKIYALALMGLISTGAFAAERAVHCTSAQNGDLREVIGEISGPDTLANLRYWAYYDGKATLMKSEESSKANTGVIRASEPKQSAIFQMGSGHVIYTLEIPANYASLGGAGNKVGKPFAGKLTESDPDSRDGVTKVSCIIW